MLAEQSVAECWMGTEIRQGTGELCECCQHPDQPCGQAKPPLVDGHLNKVVAGGLLRGLSYNESLSTRAKSSQNRCHCQRLLGRPIRAMAGQETHQLATEDRETHQHATEDCLPATGKDRETHRLATEECRETHHTQWGTTVDGHVKILGGNLIHEFVASARSSVACDQ